LQSITDCEDAIRYNRRLYMAGITPLEKFLFVPDAVIFYSHRFNNSSDFNNLIVDNLNFTYMKDLRKQQMVENDEESLGIGRAYHNYQPEKTFFEEHQELLSHKATLASRSSSYQKALNSIFSGNTNPTSSLMTLSSPSHINQSIGTTRHQVIGDLNPLDPYATALGGRSADHILA